MNDLERFIELYKSVGIYLSPIPNITEEGNQMLLLEAKEHEKISGYSGFVTDIIFDKDGNFIEQNIYE